MPTTEDRKLRIYQTILNNPEFQATDPEEQQRFIREAPVSVLSKSKKFLDQTHPQKKAEINKWRAASGQDYKVGLPAIQPITPTQALVKGIGNDIAATFQGTLEGGAFEAATGTPYAGWMTDNESGIADTPDSVSSRLAGVVASMSSPAAQAVFRLLGPAGGLLTKGGSQIAGAALTKVAPKLAPAVTRGYETAIGKLPDSISKRLIQERVPNLVLNQTTGKMEQVFNPITRLAESQGRVRPIGEIAKDLPADAWKSGLQVSGAMLPFGAVLGTTEALREQRRRDEPLHIGWEETKKILADTGHMAISGLFGGVAGPVAGTVVGTAGKALGARPWDTTKLSGAFGSDASHIAAMGAGFSIPDIAMGHIKPDAAGLEQVAANVAMGLSQRFGQGRTSAAVYGPPGRPALEAPTRPDIPVQPVAPDTTQAAPQEMAPVDPNVIQPDVPQEIGKPGEPTVQQLQSSTEFYRKGYELYETDPDVAATLFEAADRLDKGLSDPSEFAALAAQHGITLAEAAPPAAPAGAAPQAPEQIAPPEAPPEPPPLADLRGQRFLITVKDKDGTTREVEVEVIHTDADKDKITFQDANDATAKEIKISRQAFDAKLGKTIRPKGETPPPGEQVEVEVAQAPVDHVGKTYVDTFNTSYHIESENGKLFLVESDGTRSEVSQREIDAHLEMGSLKPEAQAEPDAAGERQHLESAADNLTPEWFLADAKAEDKPLEDYMEEITGKFGNHADIEGRVNAALTEAIRQRDADEAPKTEGSKPESPAEGSLLATMEQLAKDARKRIDDSTSGTTLSSTPFRFDLMGDYTLVGAYHIYKGAHQLVEWSVKMVEEFGDGIKPYLEQIFALAVQIQKTQKEAAQVSEAAPVVEAAPVRPVSEMKIVIPDTGDKQELLTNALSEVSQKYALTPTQVEIFNRLVTGDYARLQSNWLSGAKRPGNMAENLEGLAKQVRNGSHDKTVVKSRQPEAAPEAPIGRELPPEPAAPKEPVAPSAAPPSVPTETAPVSPPIADAPTWAIGDKITVPHNDKEVEAVIARVPDAKTGKGTYGVTINGKTISKVSAKGFKRVESQVTEPVVDTGKTDIEAERVRVMGSRFNTEAAGTIEALTGKPPTPEFLSNFLHSPEVNKLFTDWHQPKSKVSDQDVARRLNTLAKAMITGDLKKSNPDEKAAAEKAAAEKAAAEKAAAQKAAEKASAEKATAEKETQAGPPLTRASGTTLTAEEIKTATIKGVEAAENGDFAEAVKQSRYLLDRDSKQNQLSIWDLTGESEKDLEWMNESEPTLADILTGPTGQALLAIHEAMVENGAYHEIKKKDDLFENTEGTGTEIPLARQVSTISNGWLRLNQERNRQAEALSTEKMGMEPRNPKKETLAQRYTRVEAEVKRLNDPELTVEFEDIQFRQDVLEEYRDKVEQAFETEYAEWQKENTEEATAPEAPTAERILQELADVKAIRLNKLSSRESYSSAIGKFRSFLDTVKKAGHDTKKLAKTAGVLEGLSESSFTKGEGGRGDFQIARYDGWTKLLKDTEALLKESSEVGGDPDITRKAEAFLEKSTLKWAADVLQGAITLKKTKDPGDLVKLDASGKTGQVDFMATEAGTKSILTTAGVIIRLSGSKDLNKQLDDARKGDYISQKQLDIIHESAQAMANDTAGVSQRWEDRADPEAAKVRNEKRVSSEQAVRKLVVGVPKTPEAEEIQGLAALNSQISGNKDTSMAKDVTIDSISRMKSLSSLVPQVEKALADLREVEKNSSFDGVAAKEIERAKTLLGKFREKHTAPEHQELVKSLAAISNKGDRLISAIAELRKEGDKLVASDAYNPPRRFSEAEKNEMKPLTLPAAAFGRTFDAMIKLLHEMAPLWGTKDLVTKKHDQMRMDNRPYDRDVRSLIREIDKAARSGDTVAAEALKVELEKADLAYFEAKQKGFQELMEHINTLQLPGQSNAALNKLLRAQARKEKAVQVETNKKSAERAAVPEVVEGEEIQTNAVASTKEKDRLSLAKAKKAFNEVRDKVTAISIKIADISRKVKETESATLFGEKSKPNTEKLADLKAELKQLTGERVSLNAEKTKAQARVDELEKPDQVKKSQEALKNALSDAPGSLNTIPITRVDLMAHAALVGAYHLYKGTVKLIDKALTFKDWSATMVQELGKKIKPHLLKLWGMARKMLDEYDKKMTRVMNDPKFQRFKGEHGYINLFGSNDPGAPVMYSRLNKLVEDIQGEAITARKLKQMLDTAGVPEEELNYSGIRDFLTQAAIDNNTVLDKALMLAHVEDKLVNSLVLTERVAGPMKDSRLDNVRIKLDEVVKQIANIRERGVGSLDVAGYERFEALKKERVALEQEQTAAALDGRGRPKWAKGDGQGSMLTEGAHTNYREFTFALPSKGVYESAHWRGYGDVVFHVRTSDRVNADGTISLHIEEVQSDWHQKGVAEGYAVPRDLTPAETKRLEAGLKEIAALESRQFQLFKDYQPYESGTTPNKEFADALKAAQKLGKAVEAVWPTAEMAVEKRNRLTDEYNTKYAPLIHGLKSDIHNLKIGPEVWKVRLDITPGDNKVRIVALKKIHGESPDIPVDTTNYIDSIGWEADSASAARGAINNMISTAQRTMENRYFDAVEKVQEEIKKLKGGAGIPDAPYKDKEWMRITLKRMLKFATTNGYERVTWSTGDQIAQIYNKLFENVQKIDWGKQADTTDKNGEVVKGGYIITVHTKDGREQTLDKPVKDGALNDTVGKLIAEQIRQEVKDAAEPWNDADLARNIKRYEERTGYGDGHYDRLPSYLKRDALMLAKENWEAHQSEPTGVVEGENLKVSDAGYIQEYDKDLPGIMKKLLADFGVKVGKSQLKSLTDPKNYTTDDLVPEQQGDANEWLVYDRANNTYVLTHDLNVYSSREEAQRYIDQFYLADRTAVDQYNSVLKNTAIHSVELTPEVKAALTMPIPMYGPLDKMVKAKATEVRSDALKDINARFGKLNAEKRTLVNELNNEEGLTAVQIKTKEAKIAELDTQIQVVAKEREASTTSDALDPSSDLGKELADTDPMTFQFRELNGAESIPSRRIMALHTKLREKSESLYRKLESLVTTDKRGEIFTHIFDQEFLNGNKYWKEINDGLSNITKYTPTAKSINKVLMEAAESFDKINGEPSKDILRARSIAYRRVELNNNIKQLGKLMNENRYLQRLHEQLVQSISSDIMNDLPSPDKPWYDRVAEAMNGKISKLTDTAFKLTMKDERTLKVTTGILIKGENGEILLAHRKYGKNKRGWGWNVSQIRYDRYFKVFELSNLVDPEILGPHHRGEGKEIAGRDLFDPEIVDAFDALDNSSLNPNMRTRSLFDMSEESIISTEGVPQSFTELVKDLHKHMRLQGKIFITTSEDMSRPDATDKYNIGQSEKRLLGEMDSYAYALHLKDGHYAIVLQKEREYKFHKRSPIRDLLDTKKFHAILHEFGHVVHYDTWSRTPEDVREAVYDDYLVWLQANRGKTAAQYLVQFSSPDKAVRYKFRPRGRGTRQDGFDGPAELVLPKLAKRGNGRFEGYYGSFAEYYAESFTKWALTSEKPKSLVDRYFHTISRYIQRLYKYALTGTEARATDVFRDYLDALSRDFDPTPLNDSFYSMKSIRGDIRRNPYNELSGDREEAAKPQLDAHYYDPNKYTPEDNNLISKVNNNLEAGIEIPVKGTNLSILQIVPDHYTGAQIYIRRGGGPAIPLEGAGQSLKLTHEELEKLAAQDERISKVNNTFLKFDADGPFYEVSADVGVKATRSIPKHARQLVEQARKALKLDGRIFITTQRDVMGLKGLYLGLVGPYISGRAAAMHSTDKGRIFSFGPKGRDYVLVLNEKSSPEAIAELLRHELGHAVENEYLNGHNQMTKDRLVTEHEAFVAAADTMTYKEFLESTLPPKLAENAVLEADPAKLKALAKDVLSNNWEGYHLSFKEWFANQTARALHDIKPQSNIVSRFFTGLAIQLKKLWSHFTGKPATVFKDGRLKVNPEITKFLSEIKEGSIINPHQPNYMAPQSMRLHNFRLDDLWTPMDTTLGRATRIKRAEADRAVLSEEIDKRITHLATITEAAEIKRTQTELAKLQKRYDKVDEQVDALTTRNPGVIEVREKLVKVEAGTRKEMGNHAVDTALKLNMGVDLAEFMQPVMGPVLAAPKIVRDALLDHQRQAAPISFKDAEKQIQAADPATAATNLKIFKELNSSIEQYQRDKGTARDPKARKWESTTTGIRRWLLKNYGTADGTLDYRELQAKAEMDNHAKLRPLLTRLDDLSVSDRTTVLNYVMEPQLLPSPKLSGLGDLIRERLGDLARADYMNRGNYLVGLNHHDSAALLKYVVEKALKSDEGKRSINHAMNETIRLRDEGVLVDLPKKEIDEYDAWKISSKDFNPPGILPGDVRLPLGEMPSGKVELVNIADPSKTKMISVDTTYGAAMDRYNYRDVNGESVWTKVDGRYHRKYTPEEGSIMDNFEQKAGQLHVLMTTIPHDLADGSLYAWAEKNLRRTLGHDQHGNPVVDPAKMLSLRAAGHFTPLAKPRNAQEFGQVADGPPKGWEKEWEEVDDPRFGALYGKYVHKDLARFINVQMRLPEALELYLDKVSRIPDRVPLVGGMEVPLGTVLVAPLLSARAINKFYKTQMTIYAGGAHSNNFIGNTSMAIFLYHIHPKYMVKATGMMIEALKAGAPLDAEHYGLGGGNYEAVTGKVNMTGAQFRHVQKMWRKVQLLHKEGDPVGSFVHLLRTALKGAGAAYQGSDKIFRLAHYLKSVEAYDADNKRFGLSQTKAEKVASHRVFADKARKAFVDYQDQNSVAARLLQTVPASPFFAYGYGIAPRIWERLNEYPMHTLGMLPILAAAQLAFEDDETRTAREALPVNMRGNLFSADIIPKAILGDEMGDRVTSLAVPHRAWPVRVPGADLRLKDTNDNQSFVNISPWVPGENLLKSSKYTATDMPQIFMMYGPTVNYFQNMFNSLFGSGNVPLASNDDGYIQAYAKFALMQLNTVVSPSITGPVKELATATGSPFLKEMLHLKKPSTQGPVTKAVGMVTGVKAVGPDYSSKRDKDRSLFERLIWNGK